VSSESGEPSSDELHVPGKTTIRNYRSGDEWGWLALLQAAPDFPYLFLNRSPSLDALRMTLAHPWMDATHNLFVAEGDGRLAGYSELWHSGGHSAFPGACWSIQPSAAVVWARASSAALSRAQKRSAAPTLMFNSACR